MTSSSAWVTAGRSGRSSETAHLRSWQCRARWAADRRARPHSRCSPEAGAVASIGFTEAISAILVSDAPATARSFDLPQRRAPSAGTCFDMTEFRPHQPTVYALGPTADRCGQFPHLLPSGPRALHLTAIGGADLKMLTPIFFGRKHQLAIRGDRGADRNLPVRASSSRSSSPRGSAGKPCPGRDRLAFPSATLVAIRNPGRVLVGIALDFI